MEFFNFGNQETFHFFTWVAKSGRVNIDSLIEKAYKRAENPDNDLFPEGEICVVVRDHLTEELVGVLEILAPWDISEVEFGKVLLNPLNNYSLWQPIFANAVARIDCTAVAQAFLIRAGKWAPSKVRLKAI